LAKERKPTTAQKPPVPSDSHAEIEDWIRRVMPDLHPIVKRLDELICETLSGLQYAIKWKKAYHGVPELGWIIEMVAYYGSVNAVFFGGAEFDPAPPLETTGRTRYVKVTTLRRHSDRRCTSGSSKRGASRVGNDGALGEDAGSPSRNPETTWRR
jgi:hypothetical protein